MEILWIALYLIALAILCFTVSVFFTLMISYKSAMMQRRMLDIPTETRRQYVINNIKFMLGDKEA